MAPQPRSLPPLPRWSYNGLVLAEHALGRRRADLVLGGPGTRLQRILARRLAGQQEGQVLPVPEAPAPGRERFHARHLRNLEPVVFRGMAAKWRAVQDWSLDWFIEHYGDADVLLKESEGTSGEQVEPDERRVPFREFAGDIRAGLGRYIRFGTFFDENPELLDHLDVDALHELRGPSVFQCGYKAFIGGDGSTTHLHNAINANFFVQIEGRKRWRLYPANYAVALRMPATRGNYNYSYARPDQLDDPRFPALRFLDSWEVTLNPGDVLYVPPWMWHHVVNEGENIGMSYRFTDLRASFKSSTTFTVMRTLSPDMPIWWVSKGILKRERFYVHGYQKL